MTNIKIFYICTHGLIETCTFESGLKKHDFPVITGKQNRCGYSVYCAYLWILLILLHTIVKPQPGRPGTLILVCSFPRGAAFTAAIKPSLHIVG
jgi:hypothetical protein